jgi:hypothetical protein
MRCLAVLPMQQITGPSVAIAADMMDARPDMMPYRQGLKNRYGLFG